MLTRYARGFVCVIAVAASTQSGWAADDKLPRTNLDPAKDRQLPTSALEVLQRAQGADDTRAFGGEGYSTRVDLGDRLQDLIGLRIADGTTDVMRMMVVRKVYGEEFWEMGVQPKREAVKPEK